jgi:hypothetical protein
MKQILKLTVVLVLNFPFIMDYFMLVYSLYSQE